ncbi:RING finger and WD repeat domain-containing protein 3 [Chytridiales sp. JEL 0842]|nr:RING finger and WD repeat domain-containing protein 3 [Chytridiales sp. JEL 0842]
MEAVVGSPILQVPIGGGDGGIEGGGGERMGGDNRVVDDGLDDDDDDVAEEVAQEALMESAQVEDTLNRDQDDDAAVVVVAVGEIPVESLPAVEELEQLVNANVNVENQPQNHHQQDQHINNDADMTNRPPVEIQPVLPPQPPGNPLPDDDDDFQEAYKPPPPTSSSLKRKKEHDEDADEPEDDDDKQMFNVGIDLSALRASNLLGNIEQRLSNADMSMVKNALQTGSERQEETPPVRRASTAPSRSSEVRKLFVTQLTAEDNSAPIRLREETKKFESILRETQKHLNRLQPELASLRAKHRNLKMPPVVCRELYHVSHDNSARVLGMSSISKNIFATTSESKSDHGVAMYNLSDPKRQRRYVSLHKGVIRDLKISTDFADCGGKELMLTASVDKTLLLRESLDTAGQTKTVFNLPNPVWSCCFDAKRPEYIYAGTLGKSYIYVFDIRNNSSHVKIISEDSKMGGGGMSLHSLQYLEATGGLLGGSLKCPFVLTPSGFEASLATVPVVQCVPIEPGKI